MCGRPRFGKGCFDGDASWSGAAMCSACLRDTTIAGPNAIRGSGPNHKHALVVRHDPNGFSRPSVLDRFCITSQSLRQTRELLASVALRSDRGRLPIGATMSQERPGDAGVLVGQRHGRDLGRLVGDQPGKPRVRRAVPLGVSDDRHGASNQ